MANSTLALDAVTTLYLRVPCKIGLITKTILNELIACGFQFTGELIYNGERVRI
jgi:hypothetical protein